MEFAVEEAFCWWGRFWGYQCVGRDEYGHAVESSGVFEKKQDAELIKKQQQESYLQMWEYKESYEKSSNSI